MTFNGSEEGSHYQGFSAVPGVNEIIAKRLENLAVDPNSELNIFLAERLGHPLASKSRGRRTLVQELEAVFPHGNVPSDMSSENLLADLCKVLALPGTANSYQQAFSVLGPAIWYRSWAEPELIEPLECLCWIDIDFILGNLGELNPKLFAFNVNEFYMSGFFPFEPLIELYEREGYLLEASEVAECAVLVDRELLKLSYGQLPQIRLKAQIASIQAEASSV